MARPRRDVDLVEIIALKWAGRSYREIARRTGLGKGTVVRYHRRAVELLALSQNPKANRIKSTVGGNEASSRA